MRFSKDGKQLTFAAGGFKFEYDLGAHTVKSTGKAPTRGRSRTGSSRGRSTRGRSTRGRSTSRSSRGSSTRRSSSRRTRSDGRSYSPDKTTVVFAKDNNLYLIEGRRLPVKIAKSSKSNPKPAAAPAKPAGKTDEAAKNGAIQTASATKKPSSRKKGPPAPRFAYDEKKAVQLSKDGVDGFGFGGAIRTATSRTTRGSTRSSTRGTTRGRTSSSPTRGPSRTRMSTVSWSKDSKAFYTTRRDSRIESKELFLVNSTAQPRPRLSTYRYRMPGEERGITELHYLHKDNMKLVRLPRKWKGESYSGMRWQPDGATLRFTRRERTMRRREVAELDAKTGKVKVLFRESSKDGYLKTQSPRRLTKRKQFIWWSERTGWGHYYLYDENYTLKNAITSGAFRVSSIVSLDEEKGVMWVRANGREKGENVYNEHLYRVHLDGSGMTLLDPGPGTHRSTLSPSKRFLVDNATAVDMAPYSVLRNSEGQEVMKLETMDLSSLRQVGWKMPSTFVVKAADGVTDLYGNMWKPFDFDAKKNYPIIVSVYPGPQMEGVSRSFSATSSLQQLAQLGFIVIQVGHRGGTPKRSRAYANHGYYNLRDYGLADKKAAIEQLAMRHDFIDIERVGIFGHSGGGFMTGAALLQKPYNEFFTAGIATSGNHDNNIYNSSWSERYHGLKEVATKEKAEEKVDAKAETSRTRGRRSQSGESKRATTAKNAGAKKAEAKKADKKTGKEVEKKTRFEIRVPTNAELAANLKGHLMLVHGELDNNVHPANTMRLVDALIKANKRFDMLIIPGARHGYGGQAGRYVTQRKWEFWARHLLGEHQSGADIMVKDK